jgi:hypothetical protein
MHVVLLHLCIVSFAFDVDCINSTIGYVAVYFARKNELIKKLLLVVTSVV